MPIIPACLTRLVKRGALRIAIPAVLLSTCLAGHALAHTVGATVRTDAGLLHGARTSVGISFLGVPFAAPPVGELRWRAPQPVAAWNGVRTAQGAGPTCMQDPRIPPAGIGNNSEDCLYLNVHVPPQASTDKPLPVMVWIHGGAFINGAGSQYDGSTLAREAGVVVVTLN